MEDKVYTQKDLHTGDDLSVSYFDLCYGDFKDISMGNYYSYFIPRIHYTIMALNKDYVVFKKNDEDFYNISINDKQVNSYKPYVMKTSLLLDCLNRRKRFAYFNKPGKINRAYYADVDNLTYNYCDEINNFSYEDAKNALRNFNSKVKETKLDKVIAGYGDVSITGETFTKTFDKNNKGK